MTKHRLFDMYFLKIMSYTKSLNLILSLGVCFLLINCDDSHETYNDCHYEIESGIFPFEKVYKCIDAISSDWWCIPESTFWFTTDKTFIVDAFIKKFDVQTAASELKDPRS